MAERDRPAGAPVMYQRWEDLLFLHWSVDPASIAHMLPSGLYVDTFQGNAWVGVVPFSMSPTRCSMLVQTLIPSASLC